MSTDKFIAYLTAIVVLGYMAASIYAFMRNGLAWADFSGAIGPVAGTQLGYFIRGAQK